MKASKLVYNCNGYDSVNSVAQVGIEFSINNKKKFYGLEEWNKNKIIKNLTLGYLDSFRAKEINGIIEDIVLFFYNPNKKEVYLVGCLKNVRQLDFKEIQEIRNNLTGQNWLINVSENFHNINDDGEGFEKYRKCYSSNNIIAKSEESFVFNLQYEKLLFLKTPLNLTAFFPEINNLKRLSVLYNLNEEIQEFIIKKCK
jgi:hypothetical protein